MMAPTEVNAAVVRSGTVWPAQAIVFMSYAFDASSRVVDAAVLATDKSAAVMAPDCVIAPPAPRYIMPDPVSDVPPPTL